MPSALSGTFGFFPVTNVSELSRELADNSKMCYC
jgi:hypothetical protein